MEILEFGDKEKSKIILIHGFESPHQVWEEFINYYKDTFHIIVPILPGHNSNKKEDFISFSKTATELEKYIIKNHGTNIYALYGMSMGGVIGAHLWQNQKLNINNIIFESTPLVSYGKLMTTVLTKQYISLTKQTKQRNKKILKQATNSIIREDQLEIFLKLIDNITDQTIINYIEGIGTYKLPTNINTKNTNIFYIHGTKLNEVLAQKTAKYLRKHYPKSKIIKLKNKGHCEDSIMNPKEMIKLLDEILK